MSIDFNGVGFVLIEVLFLKYLDSMHTHPMFYILMHSTTLFT